MGKALKVKTSKYITKESDILNICNMRNGSGRKNGTSTISLRFLRMPTAWKRMS